MGIQKDAGEILVLIYNLYTQDKGLSFQLSLFNISKKTKWDSSRINRAFDYLRDIAAIKTIGCLGNTEGVYNFTIFGLTPNGIGMIENEREFVRNFNFEIGIPGIFTYSWGAQEK